MNELNKNHLEARPHDEFVMVGIFLLSFIWFISHALPSTFFGDNGELLAAVRSGGIPHPTGFPLYLLLGVLPAHYGIVYANMTASFVAAVSVVLLFLLAKKLFGTNSAYLAVGAYLGSCTLLSQASMDRVYVYQVATMLWVSWAAASFQCTKRWGLYFGFAVGLSMGTHVLFISGLIFSAVLLARNLKNVLALLPWIAMGGILGVSLYVWIPIRAQASPQMVWGEPASAKLFWAYLTQRDYSSKMFSRDWMGAWIYARAVFRTALVEWNPIFWFLAAVGGWAMWKDHRLKFYALMALIGWNVLQMYFYGTDIDQIVVYRYFLPAIASLSICAGVGGSEIWKRYANESMKKGLLGFAALLLWAGVFMSWPAWKYSDARDSVLAHRYFLGLVKYVPRNAKIVASGDNAMFAMNYGMIVEGKRTDLNLMAELPPEISAGEVVYTSRYRSVAPPYLSDSWGLVNRVYQASDQTELPRPLAPFWQPLRPSRFERQLPEAQEALASYYLQEGTYFSLMGEKAKAHDALISSLAVSPNSSSALQNAAVFFSMIGENDQCESCLLKALDISPKSIGLLLNIAVFYGKNGRYDECDRYLRKASAVKENDPNVKRYLWMLYQQSRGQFGSPY